MTPLHYIIEGFFFLALTYATFVNMEAAKKIAAWLDDKDDIDYG